MEGEPVALGSLEYNVLFTRPLNIDDVEDSQYLVGQPDPIPAPPTSVSSSRSRTLPRTGPHAAHQLRTGRHQGQYLREHPEREHLRPQAGYGSRRGRRRSGDRLGCAGRTDPGLDAAVQDERRAMENRPVQLVINGEDGCPATVDIDL